MLKGHLGSAASPAVMRLALRGLSPGAAPALIPGSRICSAEAHGVGVKAAETIRATPARVWFGFGIWEERGLSTTPPPVPRPLASWGQGGVTLGPRPPSPAGLRAAEVLGDRSCSPPPLGPVTPPRGGGEVGGLAAHGMTDVLG